jgi:hypothetical protein
MKTEAYAELIERRLARKKKELRALEETMPNHRTPSAKFIELEAIVNELEFVLHIIGN